MNITKMNITKFFFEKYNCNRHVPLHKEYF